MAKRINTTDRELVRVTALIAGQLFQLDPALRRLVLQGVRAVVEDTDPRFSDDELQIHDGSDNTGE